MAVCTGRSSFDLLCAASAPFLHMPALVALAGQDRIVDNCRTRDFFGRLASRKKTLVEYAGAAHTLEFEADPMPYFADLTAWIEGRVREC